MQSSVTQSISDFISHLNSSQSWIVEVFVVVLVTLVANYVAIRVLNRIERGLKVTENLWDDALIFAAKKPLAFLIWVVGLSWAADIARVHSDSAIFNAIDPVRDVLVVFLLSWFLVRFVRAAEDNLLDREKDNTEEGALDEQTVHALGKLVRLSIIITASLVALQTLGYSISGVLAFGGIGGIAVGFAAKDLLANFFGGLMIYLDRPFSIGDWIRSPDQEIEGTVEHIGWRQTRIRTFSKRPLYVPNSTFMNISVENPSRMTNRRIYETIGLRYADAAVVAKIVTEVKDFLSNHVEIDTNQIIIVNFNAYNDSSLDFFVYCFTKTVDWAYFHEVKQEILLGMLDIIASNNAEVAFPTRTLEISQIEALASKGS